MLRVFALAVLAVFAAVTDSSVIPSYENNDSYDDLNPLSIVYSDVIDANNGDYSVIPSLSSVDEIPTDELYPSGNTDFSIIPSISRSSSLSLGTIGNTRRLILIHVNRPAIANTIQRQNIDFRRAGNARISAVRAFPRVVANQGASVVRTGGGVGQTFVTLSITSRRGGPIFYQVEIFGP